MASPSPAASPAPSPAASPSAFRRRLAPAAGQGPTAAEALEALLAAPQALPRAAEGHRDNVRRRVAESKARIQAGVSLRRQQQHHHSHHSHHSHNNHNHQQQPGQAMYQPQAQQYDYSLLESGSEASRAASPRALTPSRSGSPRLVRSRGASPRLVHSRDASPGIPLLRRSWRPSATEIDALGSRSASPPASPSSRGTQSPPQRLCSGPASPLLDPPPAAEAAAEGGGPNDRAAAEAAVRAFAVHAPLSLKAKRRSSPLSLAPLRRSLSALSDERPLGRADDIASSDRLSPDGHGALAGRGALAGHGAPNSHSAPSSRPLSGRRDAGPYDASPPLRRQSAAPDEERRRGSQATTAAGSRASTPNSGGKVHRRLPATPTRAANPEPPLEQAGGGQPSAGPSPPLKRLGTPRFNTAVGGSMELSRHVLQLGDLRVPAEEPPFKWMLARSCGMARAKLGRHSDHAPHRTLLLTRLRELAQAERESIENETWGYNRKAAAGRSSPEWDREGGVAAGAQADGPAPLTAMLGDLRGLARAEAEKPPATEDATRETQRQRRLLRETQPLHQHQGEQHQGQQHQGQQHQGQQHQGQRFTPAPSQRPTLTEIWDSRARDSAVPLAGSATTTTVGSRGILDMDMNTMRRPRDGSGRARRQGGNVSSAVRQAMANLDI